MTIFKTYQKYLVIIPFCLLFLISIPLSGQNRIDYISDWYYIFFSQNNLISISEKFQLDSKSSNKKNKIILNSKFSINDFYREKTGNLSRKLYYWYQVNDFRIPVTVLGKNISINVNSQIVSKNIYYAINSNESFKITHKSKKYSIYISSVVWQNYLSLLTGISTRIQSSNSKVNYNIGIQFSLNDENFVSFVRYTDYFKWNYKFCFQDPAINLNIPENTQMNEFNIQLQLFPKLTFIGLMQNNYINQDQNITSNKTTYLSTGIWFYRQMKFCYFINKTWDIEFIYNSYQSDLLGHLFQLKQSFGKITKSDNFGKMYNSGISYILNQHILGFNFTWGNGYLANRGHIESWPFTSTWVDLLGLRYNFNSRFEYKLNRYLINYRIGFSDCDLMIKCAYEILKPSGNTRTWEPEFLVFGIQNLKIYDLQYKMQNGIYLMFDLSKKLSTAIKLQYQFNQYLPVKSEKYKEPDIRISDLKKKNKSIYGGGKHQINLLIYF